MIETAVIALIIDLWLFYYTPVSVRRNAFTWWRFYRPGAGIFIYYQWKN